MIQIKKLQSASQDAYTLCDKSGFGEKKAGKVFYSIYEALYLIETKKAEADRQIKLKKQDEDSYLVYLDLRKRGYVVKTALKFGAEFRVYKKKDRHAKWLVKIIKKSQKTDWKQLISNIRISHSTGKKLLLAIIDSEKDVSYYEIDWVKP